MWSVNTSVSIRRNGSATRVRHTHFTGRSLDAPATATTPEHTTTSVATIDDVSPARALVGASLTTVQVLDVAAGGGKRYLLLGQSFMPAQQLHVLKNLAAPALSPWFDEAELDRLPKIGPSIAQRIVEYRDAHGPFARIEDLQRVKGIGPSTFAALKDLITVEP